MKSCNSSKCSQINPQELLNFYKDSSKPDKLRRTCKHCDNKRNTAWARANPEKRKNISKTWKEKNPEGHKRCEKTWRQNNPDKVKEIALKYNFGINLNEYNKLLEAQNRCCALCDRHESEFTIKLAVDHCHLTNQIRGLLCSNCNRGLGHLKHNITVLQKAISYLGKKESI